MRKKFYSALIILSVLYCLPAFLYGEGLDNLVKKTSDSILDFFSDKYNVKTSIVKFENFSGFPDILAQKYYQLLVARFEFQEKINFNDLMINFSKNQGQFNLNRTGGLNYLVYIKLIRNRDKLGVGIAIFSKSLNKTVYIKYFEELITPGEQDIINTKDYGFVKTGFSKAIEIEANRDLLDFRTIKDLEGQDRYFFYYPEKIEIYKSEGSNFKKFFAFKLKWGRPYYPVIQPEGKLSYFYRAETLYLTAGNNFSPKSKIFEFKDNQWREVDSVSFVPFRVININRNDYLVGAAYQEGKNYFKGKILLAPFRSGELRTSEIYEKTIPEFYAVTFAVNGNNLDSLHTIDKDYNYRFFSSDFEEWTVEIEKRGSALCALKGEWLAVSDYSRLTDKLYFYDIDKGSRYLAFENPLDGEVVFISAGTWKRKPGFWVYVRLPGSRGKGNFEYRLQFWSKNDD